MKQINKTQKLDKVNSVFHATKIQTEYSKNLLKSDISNVVVHFRRFANAIAILLHSEEL